ncbi:hypothetical protein HB777_38870 (plasmid) [Mesorhizobium loti]|nr:hypothetical protein HB777_38870 [Mesorhizobium loti]
MVPIIRKASEDDFQKIMDWLRAEREETGEGFYCNRSVIEDAHADHWTTLGAATSDVKTI